MILEDNVPRILISDLKFTNADMDKIRKFRIGLLSFNQKYNLISKSTESSIWSRHILDSAQLVKFIDFKSNKSLVDLGSGGGFPGLILAIYNKNPKFHVKLYDKSMIKLKFLENMISNLDIKCDLGQNVDNEKNLKCDYITSRAFKKFPEILNISREKVNKDHKIIVLKGKSAQDAINKASKNMNFKYKLYNSMTDKESKIIIVEATKSE